MQVRFPPTSLALTAGDGGDPTLGLEARALKLAGGAELLAIEEAQTEAGWPMHLARVRTAGGERLVAIYRFLDWWASAVVDDVPDARALLAAADPSWDDDVLCVSELWRG